MQRHSQQAVERWTPGETLDIEAQMKELTLRILVEALFGSDIDYEETGVLEMARHLEAPGKPGNMPFTYLVPEWVPIPMWRRYKRAIAGFEEIIDDLVERRRGDTEQRDDLLSTLLVATDDEGDGMSDQQLRDEIMSLLFAGHETTAIALTYAWYELARNPAVAERMHAELDEVLGGAAPTVADLPDLEITENVLRETLRLYPPTPLLVREPTTDVQIGSYTVPEGTMVGACQWAIHRDDELYDDPETFDPTRWRDRPESDRPSFAYFPFGGGPRQCLGKQFAMLEGLLILATIAQQVEFELVSEEPIESAPGLVLLPLTDVEMTVQSRN